MIELSSSAPNLRFDRVKEVLIELNGDNEVEARVYGVVDPAGEGIRRNFNRRTRVFIIVFDALRSYGLFRKKKRIVEEMQYLPLFANLFHASCPTR